MPLGCGGRIKSFAEMTELDSQDPERACECLASARVIQAQWSNEVLIVRILHAKVTIVLF